MPALTFRTTIHCVTSLLELLYQRENRSPYPLHYYNRLSIAFIKQVGHAIDLHAYYITSL